MCPRAIPGDVDRGPSPVHTGPRNRVRAGPKRMRPLLLVLLFTCLACARVDGTRIDRDPTPTLDAAKAPEPSGIFRGLEWTMSPSEAQKTLEAHGVKVRYEETRAYHSPPRGVSPAPIHHTNEPYLVISFEGASGGVVFDDDQKMVRIEIRSMLFDDEAAARENAPSSSPSARVFVRAEPEGSKWRRVVVYTKP